MFVSDQSTQLSCTIFRRQDGRWSARDAVGQELPKVAWSDARECVKYLTALGVRPGKRCACGVLAWCGTYCVDCQALHETGTWKRTIADIAIKEKISDLVKCSACDGLCYIFTGIFDIWDDVKIERTRVCETCNGSGQTAPAHA